MSMYKEGDILEITKVTKNGSHWKIGEIFRVNKHKNPIPDRKIHDCTPYLMNYEFKVLTITGGNTMSKSINSTIASIFENTKDALLVTRFFSEQIPENFVSTLIIKEYKEEILKEAKRLEQEALDK